VGLLGRLVREHDERRRVEDTLRSERERETARSADAASLADLGVVDVDFYGALVGIEFPDETAAAAHYLDAPDRAELPLNPLVEPGWLVKSRRGSKIGWLDALRGPAGMFSTSPVFDPHAYRLVVGDLEGQEPTTLAYLRHFLSTATTGSVLPVHPSRRGPAPTWGAFRREAIERAGRDAADAAFARRRYRDTWDVEEEDAFRTRMAPFVARLVEEPDVTVSVVMPTRDRRKKLAKALHSLRSQTYEAWELVVVDDGSEDGSAAYLAEQAELDPRIRVLTSTGLGVSHARNAALGAVTGDYVAFLDSDNTWRPDHLLLSLAGLRASGRRSAHAGVVMHSTSATGTRIDYRGEEGSRDHLLAGNYIDLNSLVVEAPFLAEIGPFDLALRRWVDYDLVLRIADRELPAYLPFLGVDYDNRDSPDRISRSQPMGWQDVVLSRHVMDWPGLAAAAEDRVPRRVSIVIPTHRDWQLTSRAVETVLEHSTSHDVEVVVVDNGSPRHVSSLLRAQFGSLANFVLVRPPRNLNFALGSNVGFARSTGEYVLMLNNDTEVTEGWLDGMLRRIADPSVLGVQPLLLYPDDTVQAAGTLFGGARTMPWHFLAGHPSEDAHRAGDISFTAVTAAALLMRADDFIALEGFDPVFTNGLEDVDLCLRAGDLREGDFRVALDSIVYHHESKTPGRMTAAVPNRVLFDERWVGRYPADQRGTYETAGFSALHYASHAPATPMGIRTGAPVVVRQPRAVGSGPGEGRPSLRWALKIAAHPGERGRHWGDTIFARDLARSLRHLGQEVVVDSRLAFYRTTSHLDDVVVTLRGLEVVVPQPGAVNVLWIISHPELVTEAELRSYDVVYAASPTWARHATERWGVEVRVLLQATDAERFGPGGEGGTGVVFVGSTRGEYRPVVRGAVSAGVDVAVYGPGWRDLVPAGTVRAESLDPRETGVVYRDSEIVLADHWADMAAAGFISNRVFDAVASGAAVLSDDVAGLSEIFGDSVMVAADESQVAARLRDRSWVPSPDERRAAAERVLSEHSFDARASTLLQDVLTVRSAGPDTRSRP
jgi:GT2 family glycosyltransferase